METRDLDKVLVDTSAWIEFFKKKEPWYSAVSGLMDEKRVCCSGIILAELIQGAKSEKELEILRDFRHVFEFLDESIELWQAAGELSQALLRKGKSIGLSDCYLAVAAKANKVHLLTLDKHFDVIKNFAHIALYEVKKDR
jgi:predicted nucleic acid-binding protein